MRILVVEDEPRLLRNLAKALREEGYAVDTADAGDEGLYKAESYDYDAMVLDVMLHAWTVGRFSRACVKRNAPRLDAHGARCDARPGARTRYRGG